MAVGALRCGALLVLAGTPQFHRYQRQRPGFSIEIFTYKEGLTFTDSVWVRADGRCT